VCSRVTLPFPWIQITFGLGRVHGFCTLSLGTIPYEKSPLDLDVAVPSIFLVKMKPSTKHESISITIYILLPLSQKDVILIF
jgi:hypothetical protein